MHAERCPPTVPDPDPRERALARTLGQPDLLARVLLARGIDDPDRARTHLRPDLSTLSDPLLFKDGARAVERIRRAIRDRESIVIHGDYDVDGVAGTVLLLKFFALMEADVRPYIPDRRSGYSFSDESVRAIRAAGHRLCISVDNGTNAVGPIEQIQANGCDVIVTDHHGTSDGVAQSFATLNPRLPEAGYPDHDLAGVGVAFRLAAALAQSFSPGRQVSEEFQEFLIDAMAYVALGTIADVAPLRGENRTMVFHGLRALAVSKNPGIRALLDCAGLAHRSPDAEDVAFRVAPLINAAGRMGQATKAVELLMARGYQEAQAAARVLEEHNQERRRVERELLETVRAEAERSDDAVVVLGGDGWHAGVLGIVAARIAETFHRPTILVAFDGDKGRGSGRSPNGLHLREAMHACAPLLASYGGHAAAAGLEIAREHFAAFRERINAVAADMTSARPLVEADGAAQLDELDPRTVRKLDQLGPFGAGNRRPTFASRGVRVVGNPSVDSRFGDLRFRVAQRGIVVPARLRAGAAHFETIRNQRDPITVYHSPRLSHRSDDGPVELLVWHFDRPAGLGDMTR